MASAISTASPQSQGCTSSAVGGAEDATVAERSARDASHRTVDADAVSGRAVLVLDDIFVTGGTLFSYAAALRTAGATQVLGLAYRRLLSEHARRYRDALAWARATHDYRWHPDNIEVARF